MDPVKEVQARMFPMDNAETLAEEVPEDRPEDPETPAVTQQETQAEAIPGSTFDELNNFVDGENEESMDIDHQQEQDKEAVAGAPAKGVKRSRRTAAPIFSKQKAFFK